MLKDNAPPSRPIEWAETAGLVPYETAVRFMEERADLVARGAARELIWLVEHAALYTAGTSARDADLVEPSRLPVYRTGRGGQFTYHGPGQRIAYVMLDVRRRFGGNIRTFVRTLEDWVIATLAGFGIEGETRCDRVGVWVKGASAAGTDTEAKIAALGIRVRHGVSFHGIALNVAPHLAHYAGIIPCGIREHGVTSLAALGVGASMKDVDILLKRAFETRLGPVATVADPLPAFIAAAAGDVPARS